MKNGGAVCGNIGFGRGLATRPVFYSTRSEKNSLASFSTLLELGSVTWTCSAQKLLFTSPSEQIGGTYVDFKNAVCTSHFNARICA